MSDERTTETAEEGVTRRSFLTMAWAAIGGLAAVEVGGVLLAYLQPRLAEGEFGGSVIAGAVDDFPPGSVTHIVNGRFYVTRFADGGFLALYQRCTHLGCAVPWDQAAGKFICPCHNSEFEDNGKVINPPAPRPLDLFALTIEDSQVLVDTGNPVARDTFSASQVVYP